VGLVAEDLPARAPQDGQALVGRWPVLVARRRVEAARARASRLGIDLRLTAR
jgi:predicted RecB family endonuclease